MMLLAWVLFGINVQAIFVTETPFLSQAILEVTQSSSPERLIPTGLVPVANFSFVETVPPSPTCGGCLANAACTYVTGASIEGKRNRDLPANATRSVASLIVKSFSISSIHGTIGDCQISTASVVTLTPPVTVKIKSSLSGTSLSQSAASAIFEYLGFVECVGNALIVTPSASTPAGATTAIPGSNGPALPSPTASNSVIAPVDLASSATPSSNTKGRIQTKVIVASVICSIAGAIGLAFGTFLLMRRRSRARMAKINSNEIASPDTEPQSFFEGKPELDTDRQRHEMEAEKERCELEAQSSIQEMTVEQIDGRLHDEANLQELRGVEPSQELDAEHAEHAEPEPGDTSRNGNEREIATSMDGKPPFK